MKIDGKIGLISTGVWCGKLENLDLSLFQIKSNFDVNCDNAR